MRDLVRLGFSAMLYGVIALGANPALAGELSKDQIATLKEMRNGDMKKLVVHKEARPRVEDRVHDVEPRRQAGLQVASGLVQHVHSSGSRKLGVVGLDHDDIVEW